MNYDVALVSLYCPMSDNMDYMNDIFVVIYCGALYVAAFRIRFDDVVAQNIDVPNSVDEFDFAIALVRAELATNIVVLGVDCMMNEATTMTVSLRTTVGYENLIEQSEKKKRKWKKPI